MKEKTTISREGLEKMEREKQRLADRDRVMKERDEKRRQEKMLEQSVLSQFEPTSLMPAKSKFVCNFFPISFPPTPTPNSVNSFHPFPFTFSVIIKSKC